MADATAPDDVTSEDMAAFFSISDSVRYVAILLGGMLTSRERPDVGNGSESESDRYEELFVNPGLLGLASARGNLDCGGLDYLIVRYGNFYQLIMPFSDGHVSVCFGPECDPFEHVQAVRDTVQRLCAIP